MPKRMLLLLALLACLGIQQPTANAQVLPGTRALYQITSGAYSVIGGFASVLTEPLPSADQAFLALTTGPGGDPVELAILGRDQQTVFLTLTNGVRAGTGIRFQYQTAHPYPDLGVIGTLDYTVTNSAGALRIDGSRSFPPVCCDIPYFFGHTNVTAIAMPVIALRVSEVELCWNSESNRTYQVQYRTELATNLWLNLGAPLAGNGSLICASDRLAPAQSRRFYRVLTLP